MKTATANTTSTGKLILIIAAAVLIYGIVAGFRATTGIFTTEIADATGLSYGTVSSISSIRNFVFAFSCIFFGLITQKIPIRYLMASGAALVTIGLVGTAFSTEYVPLLIFLGIFVGLGAGALCHAIVYAAATPFLGPNSAAICAGILSASQGFFNILITPFAQTFGTTAAGLTACFLILGAVTTCLIPLCFLFRKKRFEEPEQTQIKDKSSILAPLKYMVKRPYFYLIALAFITYGLCDGGMVNHLYEKSTEILLNNPEFSSMLVMLYGFALIIGPLIGGILASRIKNLNFLIVALFGFWCIISSFSFYLPRTTAVEIIIVLGMGLSVSALMPTLATITKVNSPESMFSTTYPILIALPIFAYSFDGYFGGVCFDLFSTFKPSALIAYILCAAVIILFLISGIKSRKEKREKLN